MFYVIFYCFALVVSSTLVSTLDTNLTISLNKQLTYDDKELYGDFFYIDRSSTVKINFTDVNVTFIIFQVHSHLYNVTLYKNVYTKGTYVTGTNIGLQSLNAATDTFYVQNLNEDIDVKVLIIVQGYGPKDPVPGGCNMEFPVPISPFMRVILYNKVYMYVDAAPPAIAPNVDASCLKTDTIFTSFHMIYLPERNFEPDVYFEGIRNMTNYLYITENARNLYKTSWPSRRMISAYPGTGAIYVAMALTSDRRYSIYVPTHSYGCSLLENDCELLDDSLSKLICASLLFSGLFICYFGHRFFKTQIVVLGFLSGLVLNYILLSIYFNLDHPALLAASVLSGVCIGLFMLVFWWIYGLPIFVIIPFCGQIGFLVASISYYISPAYVSYYLVPNMNFWSIFALIMLLVTVLLISISHIVNILCCSVVGGYTVIYSLDYYMGSNMKYIMNNVVRRLTWPEFRKALIMPPFQFNDWILTILWAVLMITGFLYQYYKNKGKPPFPPPPRSVRAVPEESMTVAETSGYGVYGTRSARRSRDCNEKTPLLA